MARTNQHCSLELCVCVFVCIKRLRAFILAWLCLQKGNQAWRPKPVGGANRIWANMQFMHPRARTHKHTNTRTFRHTQSQTHNAYDANKQTRFQVFLSYLSLYFPSFSRRQIHPRANARSATENHHLSWLRNRLPIHLSVHFSGEWPRG